MAKSIPYILQGKNIVLFVDGQPNTVTESHLNYTKLLTAIKEGDWDSVPGLISVKAALKSYGLGRVTVTENEVLFDGKAIHNALTTRMLNAFRDGFPINHFAKFMENLDANPSFRARNELIGFLDACQLPITDDGCFLAYKKIRYDWKDVYTGTIDNNIGAKPSMPRRDVNEDPNQTCSAGLHVCSYSYLKSYSGQRVVAVKVNPADVVSVPVDYDNAKMRVCQYEVMFEVKMEDALEDTLSKGPAVYVAPTTPHSKIKRSYRVEDVLENMAYRDFAILCQDLKTDEWGNVIKADQYADVLDLIEDVKISRIRKSIDELGLA
jgi:hypothetical protein